MTTWRSAVLHAVPVLGAAIVVVESVRHADEVPDALASHWSGSTADGWTSLPALTILFSSLVLVVGVGLLRLTISQAAPSSARWQIGLATGTTALLTSLHVATVHASIGLADRAATPFPAGGLGASVVVALVAGVLGWLVARATP